MRKQQSMFVRKIGLLIAYAYEQGLELTFGDASRLDHRGHKKGSLHYIRLAIDLNLFHNGHYLKSTDAHKPLGEFWESIGGIWGGRFNDGNHYSMEWEGRK